MAKDPAQAGKGDQSHLLFLSRLKSHAGAGGNIQTHASRLFAIESQRAIHFGEVVVTSNLNGPVAGMAHEKGNLVTPLVGDDRIRCKQVFAGNHKCRLQKLTE